jgi:hypothetical protein
LESERFSHDLGNVGELVENRVNFEVDKGEKPICLESAEVGRVLENEFVGSPSGPAKLVQSDKGVLFENVETELEDHIVIGCECNGPAQSIVIGTQKNAKEGGGMRRNGGVRRMLVMLNRCG